MLIEFDEVIRHLVLSYFRSFFLYSTRFRFCGKRVLSGFVFIAALSMAPVADAGDSGEAAYQKIKTQVMEREDDQTFFQT